MTLSIDTPVEQRFTFDNVSWEFYDRLLDELEGRHVFVTFDRGKLEIMSPSWKHERGGEVLGLFVRILAEELDIPLIGGGSTTFRLENVAGGIEPDQCFYVQNVTAVVGKRELDLTTDPPPDLAIEVEISRRLTNRLEVYRRLRIPEVWCYDATRLQMLSLGEDGYHSVDRSRAFPRLRVEDVHPLVEQSWSLDENAWTRQVRGWVRGNLRVR